METCLKARSRAGKSSERSRGTAFFRSLSSLQKWSAPVLNNNLTKALRRPQEVQDIAFKAQLLYSGLSTWTSSSVHCARLWVGVTIQDGTGRSPDDGCARSSSAGSILREVEAAELEQNFSSLKVEQALFIWKRCQMHLFLPVHYGKMA